MAVSYFNLMLTTDHPVAIQPGGGTATVTNAAGSASLYYGSDPGVSSTNNQGTIAAGGSQAFTQQTWIRSAGLSSVTVAVDSASAGGAGAMVLLSSTTLAADGTFDVSGISGAYSDLVIVITARGTASAFGDNLLVRLNGDSGSNYYTERMRANTTTVAGVEQVGSGSFSLTQVPAASSPVNMFGSQVWTFPGYSSTTQLKTVSINEASTINTGTGAVYATYLAGLWASTAAITRFTCSGQTTANLLAGSNLRIYGRT